MKVLVTGAHGQLGRELTALLSECGISFYAASRNDMDITSMEAVRKKLREVNPTVIIHAAAYTNVDQAEADEDLAYSINAYGSRHVAIAAREIGASLCYISTDYVFNGQGLKPYNEYDRPEPIGVYGQSKFAGEELVKSLCDKYFIVRTSWVFGQYGNNFVKTMLRLSEEKKEIGVVTDQIGSPTYTADLARFLLSLIQTEKYGIYHASNTGSCSWYEFAQAIFELTNKDTIVRPVTTEQFPRPAKRPSYSVLNHVAIRANGFKELPHWRDALHSFLQEIGEI